MSDKMSVSVKPILWTRKNRDGLYPIKIRIIQQRKSKYISVGQSVKKTDWSSFRCMVKPSHPEHKRINYEINQLVSKIENTKSKRVGNKLNNEANIVFFIQQLINQKKQGNRFYSTKRYNTLLQHLISFWGNQNLYFYDIDTDFILEFRDYLESNIKSNSNDPFPSPNTVSNYLKVLQSVINKAIQNKVFLSVNPFTRGLIPQKRKSKKITLNRDDIWFLDNLSEDREGMTRGMWDSLNVFMFCFWSQGIRIGDCLQLTYGKLIEGFFEINMDKTEGRLVFPLTKNNLYRVISYIDPLPDFYNWDKGLYLSTNMEYGEDDNFIGFGPISSPLTPEVEVLGSHTRLIQDRITLYDNLNKRINQYNSKRFIENRVDLYTDEKYNLYDREYFHLVEQSNNPSDYHWYKLYNESKDLFLRLGMKYLTEYSKKKENQNKFVFPFLRGLESDFTNKRWNKISSSTTLINKNLKKISERYNIRPFTTHYSRHTFTSLSKEMGVDIYDLKRWLGHTSVRTTEGYINSVDSSSVVRHNQRLNDLFKS